MATEITMPRLSDTMESGTIARWRKQEGDPIKKGDILAEIETDKSNMELEAYANGVLARIIVGEGESAGLGQPIALVAASEEEAQQLRSSGEKSGAPLVTPSPEASAAGNGGTQPESGPPADSNGSLTEPQLEGVPTGEAPPRAQGGTFTPEKAQPSAQPSESEALPHGRVKASPLARRMAQEHEIDLRRLTGTGPGGRITRDDVQAYLREGGAPRPAPAPAAAQQPATPAAPQPAAQTGRAPQPVEMSRMQQTIARRLTEARFTAPDFLLTAEFDMTEARALLKSIAGVDGAPKVGPNDLLIKAVATALIQHPGANAGWEDGGIVRYGRINVGNAVATPGSGLVVPVIQDANQKSLGQIATESKELTEKARSGKLAPAERENGTFTVSNLGMFGIDQFTSILNPPEACSLAVGAITPKPVVVDGEVVVRDRMRVTLTCDHRVINGAEGADFLRTLRRYVESPVLIVL